jgi:hypothetical protein
MFRMSPQSLYTHFVSETLTKTYQMVRGDKTRANGAIAQE